MTDTVRAAKANLRNVRSAQARLYKRILGRRFTGTFDEEQRLWSLARDAESRLATAKRHARN